MDLRWWGEDVNRLRALAAELVGLQPDIILTNGTTATIALQRETRTIPIVFASLRDPVASGIVPRLNQPGGNVTGFAAFEPSMGGKWLELLSEIASGLKRAAIMFNPDLPAVSAYMPSLEYMPSFETAARSLKVALITAPVHSDAEMETAIIALGREPGGGLVVVPGGLQVTQPALIISAAARNNVPAVYSQSFFARDGGLLSYGVDHPREFQVLEYLVRNEGRVVPRATLLQHVWDIHFDPTFNIIDVYVGRVRRKVDDQQTYPLIHTVRGVGFCLRVPC
jgi:putative ABC transport system substrate-binding protein